MDFTLISSPIAGVLGGGGLIGGTILSLVVGWIQKKFLNKN